MLCEHGLDAINYTYRFYKTIVPTERKTISFFFATDEMFLWNIIELINFLPSNVPIEHYSVN